jgi:Holliday junction resolvasome RuvABC DNA-binding subunit
MKAHSDETEEVEVEQLEALKKLGFKDLTLDKYESALDFTA